jgi:hypothetical protein
MTCPNVPETFVAPGAGYTSTVVSPDGVGQGVGVTEGELLELLHAANAQANAITDTLDITMDRLGMRLERVQMVQRLP